MDTPACADAYELFPMQKQPKVIIQDALNCRRIREDPIERVAFSLQSGVL
jgi:hypothetical protein